MLRNIITSVTSFAIRLQIFHFANVTVVSMNESWRPRNARRRVLLQALQSSSDRAAADRRSIHKPNGATVGVRNTRFITIHATTTDTLFIQMDLECYATVA